MGHAWRELEKIAKDRRLWRLLSAANSPGGVMGTSKIVLRGSPNMSNRLPEDVVPISYDVCLKPDLTSLTFQGWETVTIKVKSETSQISINAYDIEFVKISLKEKDKEEVKNGDLKYNKKTEIASFTFGNAVKPGEYLLSIEFTGKLNDQMRGFYRNKYVTAEGDVRYAAVTHFEATGARRAYPCWDEPAFKATFVFTLIAPKDRVAVSNMPVEEEKTSEDDANLKVVRFQTTPVMSTYLTAFVVGEYDFVESTTTNGTKVRVYCPVGKGEHGRFALEFATKALPFYEEYFKIPYGLPKLDLITYTEFPIGAMENWGLVSYREICLMIDPSKSSASARQYVALIVGHELSHNWFGNLVTMNWWSDLWLKEGFATWIEYHCVDVLMPELQVWTRFLKVDQNRALEMDALNNSHPIEVPVHDAGQIDEIFDAISYCKGACLIRMLESYIGAEAFRSGMNLYLTRHKFANTETTDLWKCMGEVKGQDVKQLMEFWTTQMGFPLITVDEEQLPDNKRKVTLKQQKFCSSQEASSALKSTKYHWKVPFSIVTSNNPRVPVVTDTLDTNSVTVTLDDCQPEHWIKVNPGQSMFYHVLYSKDSLQRLVPAIRDQLLSPEDRIGLLNDLFALCKSNYMKVTDVLEVTKSFRGNTDHAVCDIFGGLLSSLSPYMECVAMTHGVDNTYEKFVCDSLREMGERMGWDPKEGEDETSVMTREKLLTFLGIYGEATVKQEATKRFQSFVKGESSLSSDIKSPVYATVLRHGDDKVFEDMMKIYDEDTSMEDTSRIQRFLGLMPHRMEDVLKFSLSPKVRNQDSIHVMSGVRHSAKGRKLLCQFVMENWTELYDRYSTSTQLRRLVEITMFDVCNMELGKTLKNFFSSHEAQSARRGVQQGLELIQANIALIKSQSSDIRAFLKSYTASP